MRKLSVVLAGAAATMLLALPTGASAQAAGRVEVKRDHVCVDVRKTVDGTERNLHYVLTRFIVTPVDRHGSPTGQSDSTRWQRWNKWEHPRKWDRLCG